MPGAGDACESAGLVSVGRDNGCMPLNGAAFTQYSRLDPTRDVGEEGRWIACDESGYDGEQLMNGGRYLVYASVAIDDVEADHLVQELRSRAGIQQGAELKFRAFQGRHTDRRQVLRELWEPGGALHGRCAAYIVDKEYATVAKIIDLLMEEQASADGIDLHDGREARRLARVLALQGRRALRREGFTQLMDAFIAFASQRAIGNEEATTAVFFAELEAAWAASTRRPVTEILFKLRSTRPHGDVLHVDTGPLPLLEMLVPALAEVARHWAKQLGTPVNLLTDDQKQLTDTRLEVLATTLRVASAATPSSRVPGIRLKSLVRGGSHTHPSIQLADLLAGAAAAVAGRHAGRHTPAADDLWPVVLPLIIDESLLPYDSASTLGRADEAAR